MADKEELQSQLETYNVQLQQVEAALASNPEDPDLKKLREDILEVLALTKNLLGNQPHRGTVDDPAQGVSNIGKWQVGDKVLAPWNEDGNHYEATVTSISGDGLATVCFDAYGAHETCNLNELRPRNTQVPKGSKKAQLAAQKEYKKQKALKKKERLKEIEQQREADKNKWQSFSSKALHKKKGVTKKSIFATPETVDGRVGIGTCGIADKPMTEYQQVLSGSGVYDGSEIHEASACLSHLTRHGIEPVCFAPDKEQMHVVDHVSGNPSDDKRNVLSESGRIARGKIQPLSALKAQDVGAVVFPGGFGVAKNLSTFAVDGPNCQIDPVVEKTIKEFVSAKKPLAFCCIAPILAARVISGVEITLGMDKDDGSWPYAGSVEVAKSWGASHKNCRVDQVCIDERNLVVTTPAFMYNTEKFHQIYDGVGLMIEALKKLMR